LIASCIMLSASASYAAPPFALVSPCYGYGSALLPPGASRSSSRARSPLHSPVMRPVLITHSSPSSVAPSCSGSFVPAPGSPVLPGRQQSHRQPSPPPGNNIQEPGRHSLIPGSAAAAAAAGAAAVAIGHAAAASGTQLLAAAPAVVTAPTDAKAAATSAATAGLPFAAVVGAQAGRARARSPLLSYRGPIVGNAASSPPPLPRPMDESAGSPRLATGFEFGREQRAVSPHASTRHARAMSPSSNSAGSLLLRPAISPAERAMSPSSNSAGSLLLRPGISPRGRGMSPSSTSAGSLLLRPAISPAEQATVGRSSSVRLEPRRSVDALLDQQRIDQRRSMFGSAPASPPPPASLLEDKRQVEIQNDALNKQVQELEHAKSLAAVQTSAQLRRLRNQQVQFRKDLEQSSQADLSRAASPSAQTLRSTDDMSCVDFMSTTPSNFESAGRQASAPISEPSPQLHSAMERATQRPPSPSRQVPVSVDVAVPPAPSQIPRSSLMSSLPSPARSITGSDAAAGSFPEQPAWKEAVWHPSPRKSGTGIQANAPPPPLVALGGAGSSPRSAADAPSVNDTAAVACQMLTAHRSSCGGSANQQTYADANGNGGQLPAESQLTGFQDTSERHASMTREGKEGLADVAAMPATAEQRVAPAHERVVPNSARRGASNRSHSSDSPNAGGSVTIAVASPADAAAGVARLPAPTEPVRARREPSAESAATSARGGRSEKAAKGTAEVGNQPMQDKVADKPSSRPPQPPSQQPQAAEASNAPVDPAERARSEAVEAQLEECLDTIELVAQCMSRETLQELKAISKPAPIVRDVLEVVSLLIGQHETEWLKLKRMIALPSFTDKIQKLNIQQNVSKDQFRKLREKLESPEFDEEHIKTVCVPVVPMAMWCRGIGVYLSKTRFRGGPEIRPLAGAGFVSPPPPPLPQAAPQYQTPGSITFEPDITTMSAEEIRRVPELTVSRSAVGKVTFHGETDCTGLDFTRILKLEIGEVLVYPDSASKPPIGVGLNKPATVTMYQCYPPSGNNMLRDARSQEKYKNKIRTMTEEKRAQFIDYDCHSGIWKFSVDHF